MKNIGCFCLPMQISSLKIQKAVSTHLTAFSLFSSNSITLHFIYNLGLGVFLITINNVQIVCVSLSARSNIFVYTFYHKLPIYEFVGTNDYLKKSSYTSSVGISSPVNSLNAAAPCHSSMPIPPTATLQPAAFAACTNFVSLGL